jgi:phosphatidate cytidylyltransferase
VSDWDERRRKPQRDPTEGVRIIGADEAAEALERGDAHHRLSEDEPRFGDRPPTPTSDGPRPALRFPLGSSDDPASFERPATVPVPPRAEAPELSHWAGSAAEEVPNMSRRDPRERDEAWSPYVDSGPRWRDDQPAEQPPGPPGGAWPPPDPRVPPQPPPPAYDEGPAAPPPAYDEGPVAPGYDEAPVAPAPGRSVFGDVAQEPATYGDDYGDDYGDESYDDETYDEYYAEDEASRGYEAVPPGPVGAPPPIERPSRRADRRGPRQPRQGSDRDMRTAIGVGVGVAALALGLFAVLGPLGAMLLVVPILTYAAYEYFVAVHQAGFQPLLPVGVAATAGAVLVAYNYGEGALPLVVVLTAAICFLWYLVNAGGDHPVANIGVTMLGVVWIGVFGAYAGLLLSVPTHGVAFLLAAIVPTVAYDVGGLFVGRSAGSRALSPASPNKTVEGLAGGMFLALVAGVLFGVLGVFPFEGWGDGLKIGLVAALAAPVGDLAESLVKRDLDIKDMGSLLPGHGGLLDRFDALLFVLPAMWYLARVDFLTP